MSHTFDDKPQLELPFERDACAAPLEPNLMRLLDKKDDTTVINVNFRERRGMAIKHISTKVFLTESEALDSIIARAKRLDW